MNKTFFKTAVFGLAMLVTLPLATNLIGSASARGEGRGHGQTRGSYGMHGHRNDGDRNRGTHYNRGDHRNYYNYNTIFRHYRIPYYHRDHDRYYFRGNLFTYYPYLRDYLPYDYRYSQYPMQIILVNSDTGATIYINNDPNGSYADLTTVRIVVSDSVYNQIVYSLINSYGYMGL